MTPIPPIPTAEIVEIVHRKAKEAKNFFIWACLLGLAIPILACFIIAYVRGRESLPLKLILEALSAIIIALGGVASALYCYHIHPNIHKCTDYLLYVVSVIVCIIVGTLIRDTGGMINSVFSYYLIYLPSVVAIAFTPTSRWKKGLFFTALICFIMAVIGFYGNCSDKIFDDEVKFFRVGITLIQLLAIYMLER